MDYTKIKNELAEGSHKAYELLYKHLYRNLCNYAYNIIPDKEVAEDVVQTALITLWENHRQCAEIEYLKSYLYRCVYNGCMKLLQHQKVRERYFNESEYHLKQIQFETFESSYDDEQSVQLHKALEELPEKNREVMKLRFIDGLSTNEVSDRLDITPRTVETHVSKALRFLRERLSVSSVLFFLVLCTCFYFLNDHI